MTAAPEGAWKPVSPVSDPPFESSKVGRWVLITLFVVVLGMCLGSFAKGQEHNHGACSLGDDGCMHDQFHPWYQVVAKNGKLNCCDPEAKECRPTNAWMDGGTWFTIINGQSVEVPKTAILEVDNPTDYAHSCSRTYGFGVKYTTIYCFIKPTMKG